MTRRQFYDWQTLGGSADVSSLIAALEEREIPWESARNSGSRMAWRIESAATVAHPQLHEQLPETVASRLES